jgi:hypothetical protein
MAISIKTRKSTLLETIGLSIPLSDSLCSIDTTIDSINTTLNNTLELAMGDLDENTGLDDTLNTATRPKATPAQKKRNKTQREHLNAQIKQLNIESQPPRPNLDEVVTNTTLSTITAGTETVLQDSIPIPPTYYTNCHCCQRPGHPKWWWFEESAYIAEKVEAERRANLKITKTKAPNPTKVAKTTHPSNPRPLVTILTPNHPRSSF